MAAGFIENLANRAAGNQPTVAIRPAISPEMLPETFSPMWNVQPTMPSSLEPEPKMSSPARRSGETTPAPAAKLQQGPPGPAPENNNILPKKLEETRPSLSAAHVEVQHTEPASQEKLPAKNKERRQEPANSSDGITPADEVKVHRDTHDKPAPAAPVRSGDSAKEIQKETPQEGKARYAPTVDEMRIAQAPATAPKTGEPAEQPKARLAKNVVSVKPDAKSVEKRVGTPTPSGVTGTSVVQKGRSVAHPANPVQAQAHRREDTVTINIGRIEVRAMFPQKQASPNKEQNGISLSEYLKLRAEKKL